MQLLLSYVPLVCVLGAFAYAAVVGVRIYAGTGHGSVLGVAVAMLGLMLGRLLDRFIPLVAALDDWINYRGALNERVKTQSERYLAVISVEVALLFMFSALIGFIAVTLIRRDLSGPSSPAARSLQGGLLGVLFAASLGLAGRAKIAAYLAFVLARAHLL
jgi:hypothetical protein